MRLHPNSTTVRSLISSSTARRVGGLGLAAAILAPLSSAQWFAVSMQPAGPVGSFGQGGDGAIQAGYIQNAAPNNSPRAAMWLGSAGSWVDLHPAAASVSEAMDSRGGSQAGWAQVAGMYVASLWTGSAGSWVNLNPTGALASWAYGCDGIDQAGLVDFGGVAHAALWHSTSASYVDLMPATSNSSVVWGMRGSQQVGQANIIGLNIHAGLWLGSAGSWLDLHPAVATSSRAFGTDGVQQVGEANIANATRASLWTGTAASWVDLTPFIGGISEAHGVDAGEQAGWCSAPFDIPRAFFWAGSASSAFDLSSVLPVNYGTSKAASIWHSGGHTFVFGEAQNVTAGHDEAMLWERLHMTTYCTAKVNSLGCSPSISGIGTSRATGSSTFNVRAINLQNNKPAILLYGNTGRAASAFSGGTLCVNGPLRRVQGLNTGGQPAGNNCSGLLMVDMNAFRAGALGGNPAGFLSIPGALVNCQYWARDSGFGAPNNTQLSNALEFEVGP